MNILWMIKQFSNSRLTPEGVRKDFIEAGFEKDLVEQAYRQFISLTGNKRKLVTPPDMLFEETEDNPGWYSGADNIVDSKFWPTLKNHLENVKDWTPEAVQSIHASSDKIVAWLQSPWAGSIKTRGLVVGYVQSGKTANFTAVIAKAADVGYRFFIVLSGTKKSLRHQTQQRLDRELISLNSDVWFSPTTQSDFRPIGNVNYFLAEKKHDKVICVVKKNASILNKLYKWLASANPDVLRRCPFLIIDDEADEASINTAKSQVNSNPDSVGRTAINKHLVNLLNMLPKAAYIGYTATPFANVLIDPRPGDLYPRDFIVSLPKPLNHFGTERIFGRERLLERDTDEEFEGVDMVRLIPKEDLKVLIPLKNTSFKPSLTPSLCDALHYFWMASAARLVRGQHDKHSTMLIHTTLSMNGHQAIYDVVESYRKQVIKKFHTNSEEELISSMFEQWNEEQSRVPSEMMGHLPISFNQLQPYLFEVIKSTVVIRDNSESLERLDYDGEAKIQIAVGGNTLSRGLTLEGLVVSFFVRTAQTYDTLLQMGRWFGYRFGYEDLPRLWMTAELQGYFFDLATIEAEIRQDIKNYALMGMKPSEFGVRIRTHPDLNITSKPKMQHAVTASVSYDDSHVQTVLFNHLDKDWLQKNLKSTDRFIRTLLNEQSAKLYKGHHIFYDIPVSIVISFLREYNFHENNRALNSKLLQGYIKEQNKDNKLKSWNIVIRGLITKNDVNQQTIDLGGLKLPLITRSRRPFPEEHAHISVLMSKGDVGIDLGDNIDLQLSDKDIKKERAKQLPDVGLLIIYPIKKDSQPNTQTKTKIPLDAAEHVIGLGFVFPPASEDKRGAQSYKTVDPNKLDPMDFEDDEEMEDEDA